MYIIIIFLYIVLLLILYKKNRTVNNGVVNCAMWLFLSLMVVLLDLPKNILAFAYVFLNTLCFSFGYLLVSSNAINYEIASEKEFNQRESLFLRINRYVVIINIIALIFLAYKFGFRISSFFDINNLMKLMNGISSARYTGGEGALPVINRIVNAIVYATCGYCGFFFSNKMRKELLYNLLLIMIQTVVTNTKATFVFAIAFWVAGYLTGMSFFRKRVRMKVLVIAALSLVLLLFFATTVNYLRHAGAIDYYTEFQKIIYSYFVGPFSAFTMWFENDKPSEILGLGTNTFSCIFRLLGISERTHGEFLTINEVTTNVYTIYKHLVNDFSYVGTVIISSIMGFISLLIDIKLNKQKRSSVGFSMVISAVILASFFSSLFRYTVNLVACVLIILPALSIKYGKGRA